jgi:hypothetical protein
MKPIASANDPALMTRMGLFQNVASLKWINKPMRSQATISGQSSLPFSAKAMTTLNNLVFNC